VKLTQKQLKQIILEELEKELEKELEPPPDIKGGTAVEPDVDKVTDTTVQRGAEEVAREPRRMQYGITHQKPFKIDIRPGDSPHTYIHVHGSEPVAKKTLTDFEHKGTEITISGRRRNIKIDGLTLDPNRMWTAAGAEAHLRQKNRGAKEKQITKALNSIAAHRDKILKTIRAGSGGTVVAFHNSRAGVVYPGKRNIYQHEKHKTLTKFGGGVHDGNPKSASFILVTDKGQFEKIKAAKAPFNVLFQPYNIKATDDGSLSYAMGKLGRPYINLEVRLGRNARKEQKAMLSWVNKNILNPPSVTTTQSQYEDPTRLQSIGSPVGTLTTNAPMYGDEYEEKPMKLAESKLNQIIQEELQALLQEKLTKAEKKKKAKLEKELDHLEHQ